MSDQSASLCPISLQSMSDQPVTLELLTGDNEMEPFLTGLDFLTDGRLVAVDNKNKKCIILNERLQRLGTPYKCEYAPLCSLMRTYSNLLELSIRRAPDHSRGYAVPDGTWLAVSGGAHGKIKLHLYNISPAMK
ncbi:hypothetical protein DPMN_151209 [Dreissena polymorpha]|uniref:Uncharacterized protein n=1 Tax=Dreissena polymorpha TaxID=45954 RepID=A0A9D4FJH0_DREPO|nr:hypothetical protein DPMN_151209 [Dreissena polymorpha]